MFSAGLKARLNLVGTVTSTRFRNGEQRARVEFSPDDPMSAPKWFLELPVSCFDEVAEDEVKEDTGPEIVPGSVVRLKSGGPAMTVQQIWHDLVSCTWYDERQGEFGEVVFGREALEIAQ